MKRDKINLRGPSKQNGRVPILTAEEAVNYVPDECCVYVGGDNIGICEPTSLMEALAERYRRTQKPKDLTFFLTTGVGDRVKDSDKGYSSLAVPGMVKRLYSSILGQSPKLARMSDENLCEVYNFSMGTLSQITRAAAAGQPGILSKVGLHMFCDPRLGGGKMNEKTTEDLVELTEIEGEEYLFYKTVFPDVTFLRGTTSDTRGYISSEEEMGARFLDDLAAAQAAHNRGGLVFVQVKQVVEAGSIRPYEVRIPGCLVDAIVVVPDQPQNYERQGQATDRFITGDLLSPLNLPPIPLSERKVIARRALLEGRPNDIGNIGFGVMTAIKGVANEEGVSDEITLTGETGMIGGVTRGKIGGGKPSKGSFGGDTVNFSAIIPMADMFNWYEGGGLDIAYLSFAQVDCEGNVNVSLLDHKLVGTGGFVHIASCAKTVVFGGTMTSGGFRARVGDGRIAIEQEGRFRKFPKRVDQISFSAQAAREQKQTIFYVTERCVFRLTEKGLMLVEVAPGIDIETEIFPLMEFRPMICPDLKLMDPRLFMEPPMGIREEWLLKGSSTR